MDGPAKPGGGLPRHAPFVRAFRDRYVATFVGLSYDLAADAVGVHEDVLAAAPDIAGRTVVASSDAPPAAPRRRPTFLVVPVSRTMRDARAVAEAGGVVFSSFALDDPGTSRFVEGLGVGDSVYLNAAVGRLPAAALRRPFDSDAAA